MIILVLIIQMIKRLMKKIVYDIINYNIESQNLTNALDVNEIFFSKNRIK